MVVLATGRQVKSPTIATTLSENLEGDLVRINNVTLVNQAAWTTGTGGTGFTIQVTDGTNTTDVRIDNDCPLYNQPAPTGAFDIIGMGSQFVSGNPAPVAPFPATGYQLIPRRNSDLVPVGVTGPVCSFSVASQSVAESNDTVRVNINIFPAPSTEYKVRVQVKSGTAVAGSDYENSITETITFAANTSSKQFKIKLIDDATTEGAETINLVLRSGLASSVPNATIGIDSLSTITILANDGSTEEPFPPTRTIAVIRGSNTGNQADSVGKNVRIYGTIYGLNQRLTPVGSGYQMYIRDATGGIGVFKNSNVNGITDLTEGDSVKIMGKIEVFRGFSRIAPDSMVRFATGRPIKAPVSVTTISENNESDLLKLLQVSLVDQAAWTTGSGATGFTVQVTDGTNTTDVRIDNDCPLYTIAAPAGTFSLVGMGYQFASGTAPWIGGYQLIPGKLADLTPTSSVDPICKCKSDLKVAPNPGNRLLTLLTNEKSGFHYSIFNGVGQLVHEINDAKAEEKVITETWPGGIYTIKVLETGRLIRWIKE
jgi:hypothetical protein